MIKLWIKYKICEVAIDALFKQVTNNFNIHKIEPYRIDQKFQCIMVSYNYKLGRKVDWYYDVHITNVTDRFIIVKSVKIETEMLNLDTSRAIPKYTQNYFNVKHSVINLDNITHVYPYD